MGQLKHLFWTSGDDSLGFQGQGRFPPLHIYTYISPACSGSLRFTAGVAPADLLAASMAAEPFHSPTCVRALVGLESRIKRASASQHVTRQTLYRFSCGDSQVSSFFLVFRTPFNFEQKAILKLSE